MCSNVWCSLSLSSCNRCEARSSKVYKYCVRRVSVLEGLRYSECSIPSYLRSVYILRSEVVSKMLKRYLCVLLRYSFARIDAFYVEYINMFSVRSLCPSCMMMACRSEFIRRLWYVNFRHLLIGTVNLPLRV